MVESSFFLRSAGEPLHEVMTKRRLKGMASRGGARDNIIHLGVLPFDLGLQSQYALAHQVWQGSMWGALAQPEP